MNRLEKKCMVAATGFHFLLLLALVVGPGFLAPRDVADNQPVLSFIPMTTTDGSTRGGSPIPAPPPPAVVTPPAPVPPAPAVPQQAPPTPPEPRRVVTPPPPPTPTPEKSESDIVEPPKPIHHVEVNLTQVTRSVVKNVPATPDTSEADARARRAAQRQAAAVRSALNKLNSELSSSTDVYVPNGTGGPVSANYRQLVGSAYFNAWIIPTDVDADVAVAQAVVTIARDGTVLSAHITKSSGNAAVDHSVQSALDRVIFIAPFPDGSTDDQRTFPLNFNLKAKQSLG